ncbi:unnamed protein product [Schistosoma curassoni]|uniref:Uncharacterized protein n=1 Tax=Schistosoma curassoni TaxID=6186 RepID=A0A183KHB3_9TREM|nr:unnamed protein product [Schistosoma curassoni]
MCQLIVTTAGCSSRVIPRGWYMISIIMSSTVVIIMTEWQFFLIINM